MHRLRLTPVALSAALLSATAFATPLAAQGGAASASAASAGPAATERLSEADIKALAALHVKLSAARDSADAELAQARNKTLEAQKELRHKQRELVSALISKGGLTDSAYQHRRFLVSSDGAMRRTFDIAVATLTGAPLPGVVATATAPVVAVPAGPAGVHLGHVVNMGTDTPAGVGLLPMALAEARTAAQHATLAGRTPTDLAAMQLHAGHVLHALDPSLVPMGPGKGYGVKRAATGVAGHIELAAKSQGAPANVTTHAPHVATAARAAVARADQAIALAKQVQAATSADEAAKLVGQLVSMCEKIVAGADANSDGRITWGDGEGGLQQAQEHVNLALKP